MAGNPRLDLKLVLWPAEQSVSLLTNFFFPQTGSNLPSDYPQFSAGRFVDERLSVK